METWSALLALSGENLQVTVDSPNKSQWCGTLIFSLICARTNSWATNRDAGDLRRHCAHHDVTVMRSSCFHDATTSRSANVNATFKSKLLCQHKAYSRSSTKDTPSANLQPHENSFGEFAVKYIQAHGLCIKFYHTTYVCKTHCDVQQRGNKKYPHVKHIPSHDYASMTLIRMGHWQLKYLDENYYVT